MTEGEGRYLSFDPVAAEYERTRLIPDWAVDDIARACLREARLPATGRFLDAGMGTGRFTAPLSQLAPGRVVGVDISLAMMMQARQKSAAHPLFSIQGDLQHLPFRSGVFSGALVVHVLHLVERWRHVLDQLREVLHPSGVLLLGGEQGEHSVLIDFYYGLAKARGVLGQSLGTPGLTQALAYLRRDPNATAQRLFLPYLKWKRLAAVTDTLDALSKRTYSLMWDIPDDVHAELMAETVQYAQRTVGALSAAETLEARFVLYTVRWH